MPFQKDQSVASLLKPRLVEGAKSSYDFLGKFLPKFPRYDHSTMIIDDKGMKPTLEYVGEISLEFCNERFRQKVFDALKERGVIDVRVDPQNIDFQKLADLCQKRQGNKDAFYQRYQIKNMSDTSFAYWACADDPKR
jgi:hypothetical protein